MILVISENYVDKTVPNLGRGTQIKGIDKDLLAWLKVAAIGVENPNLGSVTELMQNWNDGNNSMFNFTAESKQATQF